MKSNISQGKHTTHSLVALIDHFSPLDPLHFATVCPPKILVSFSHRSRTVPLGALDWSYLRALVSDWPP